MNLRAEVALAILGRAMQPRPYRLSWTEYIRSGQSLPVGVETLELIDASASGPMKLSCVRRFPDFQTAFRTINDLLNERSLIGYTLSAQKNITLGRVVEFARESASLHPGGLPIPTEFLSAPHELLAEAIDEQLTIIEIRESANTIPVWTFERAFDTEVAAYTFLDKIRNGMHVRESIRMERRLLEVVGQ